MVTFGGTYLSTFEVKPLLSSTFQAAADLATFATLSAPPKDFSLGTTFASPKGTYLATFVAPGTYLVATFASPTE